MYKKKVSYKKSLGQHFLQDHNIAEKIVRIADINKNDHVWEIGPGNGILTEKLKRKTENITLFELDKDLIPNLKRKFKTLRIINKDVLKCDWNQLLQHNQIKIVSNIPYNISSPLLFKIVQHFSEFQSVTLMIQRELAERLTASPSTKEYGIITVKLNFFFEIKKKFNVKPHLFKPPPKVQSTVIKLLPKEDLPQVDNFKLFWKIIDLAFNKRRKMLRVNFRRLLIREKIRILERKSGIDLRRRGETLNEKEFVDLYFSVSDLLSR